MLSTSAVGLRFPWLFFVPLLWRLSQWPVPGGMGLCMGHGVGRTPQGEHSHGRLRSKPMPARHWQHAKARSVAALKGAFQLGDSLEMLLQVLALVLGSEL